MTSIANIVLEEIGKHEADWCFFQKDFMELVACRSSTNYAID